MKLSKERLMLELGNSGARQMSTIKNNTLASLPTRVENLAFSIYRAAQVEPESMSYFMERCELSKASDFWTAVHLACGSGLIALERIDETQTIRKL